MNYPWLDTYCTAKPHAIKDYKEEWKATRYLLGNKMFAMQGTDKEKRPIITLKLEPSYGVQLRQDYPDIIPGYYMNKLHWNSVYLNGAVPEALLKELVDESYLCILHALPQKTQKELAAL